MDTIFIPIPIIKNFLRFRVINSCKIPQIFFPFKNTSFGHLKDIFFFSQKFSITLEIITGLIIENLKLIVTVEEHSIIGGLGSVISEIKSSKNINTRQISIALPSNYDVSGEYDYLKNINSLTPEKIAERIESEFK